MGQRRSASRPLSEPIRRPGIWATFVLLILAMAPWYLPEGATAPLVFGLPYWFVVSIAATLLFAAVTSWACVRAWNLAEPDEEHAAAEHGTGAAAGADATNDEGRPWTT